MIQIQEFASSFIRELLGHLGETNPIPDSDRMAQLVSLGSRVGSDVPNIITR